ncbi:hypothetical protein WG906_18390 [Pedobacter sp. P351]|uniref:hypothetical protein n=1 Tax=Pedobacter superstes TaxID=3133441 RepID=UPI0030AF403F
MSKLDKLTGKHTVNIIIALLFIITLLAYVVMSCLASDSGQSTNALFSNLLSGLVGLFGGNNFRK